MGGEGSKTKEGGSKSKHTFAFAEDRHLLCDLLVVKSETACGSNYPTLFKVLQHVPVFVCMGVSFPKNHNNCES